MAFDRTKKLPSLKSLLSAAPAKPKPKGDWREQLAVAQQWTAIASK